MTWREFFTALLGQEVAALASYTPQALQGLAYQNAPGVREMMRAVVFDAAGQQALDRAHAELDELLAGSAAGR